MKYIRRLWPIVLILITIGVLWYYDFLQYIEIEHIDEMIIFVDGFGIWGPIVFIIIYVGVTVLFLPGFPLTIMAGAFFGPIYGAIWVSIGSTVGATIAFLIARYSGRQFVVDKLGDTDMYHRIEKGVKKDGWKMVAITRLVPIFPYNGQNFIYGLTEIPLKIYTFVSWICMLPTTIAYTFLAGSAVASDGNLAKLVSYLGIGMSTLFVMSIIGRKIMEKRKLTK